MPRQKHSRRFVELVLDEQVFIGPFQRFQDGLVGLRPEQPCVGEDNFIRLDAFFHQP